MTRIEADWLHEPDLQHLLAALSAGGEEARVVGGAIRNTLMERPVTDIDVATTCLPEETARRVSAAGFKAVPTGIEHGTVTAVAPSRDGKGGRPYEVTTLRRDIETDGRHAKVLFGRDWQADAERRDFTINALYCDASGKILDHVGGLADIERRTLRFIGDAAQRTEEDYLRILRFFRFFAWYGEGRPDGDGLRAATRLKPGLKHLSAERVWAELRKTLAAPDPSRALLWMRQTGVLTAVVPESEKWGIDGVHGLMAAERLHGWDADPLLRLECIVPPDAARLAELAKRLRLGNADRDRLTAFALADPVAPAEAETAFRLRLYFGNRQASLDRLRLAIATAGTKGDGEAALSERAGLSRMLDLAMRFVPPEFPLSGDDLRAAGIPPGPRMGASLQALKRLWVESGFVLSRDRLLEKLSTLETAKGP